MKTRTLIVSAVLLGASVAVAPVQAHDSYNELWPLYGLTGLILLDSYTSHHHHGKHQYYGHSRPHYKYRRHHSHGHQRHHPYPRHKGGHQHKRKHRKGD